MNKVNLKKLSDGGERIALGTDSGDAADRFFIQGYSEHRETELMVQSGVTRMQVIQSFSKGASEPLVSTRNSAPWPRERPPTGSCWKKIRLKTSPTCGASRRSIWAAKNSSRAKQPSIRSNVPHLR